MASIRNIAQATAGAVYRVCPWRDSSQDGAPVAGYGLDEKKPGARRYTPVAWQGTATPWATLAAARVAVGQINADAQRAQAQKGQA